MCVMDYCSNHSVLSLFSHQVEKNGDRRTLGNRRHSHSEESNEVYLEDEKEKDPISPEKLHQQADEEKKKYLVLKREGKNDEALKAFKRGKEMERQAEALEHLIKRNQRRAASASTSVSSSSHVSGHRTKNSLVKSSSDSPGSPESQDLEQKPPAVQKSEPIGQKQRASSNELVKGKKASDDKDDYLKELKDLGWTDNDLHETGKKQSANEEELLLEISGEMAPKPSQVAKSSGKQVSLRGFSFLFLDATVCGNCVCKIYIGFSS